ncbi:MAG: hypothetical protein CMN28_09925 [Salinisphaeraceae bacterium]|nr:hypothetical protein [Salinisphaeraceae bacterium]
MAASMKQLWRQAVDGALSENLPDIQAQLGARLWRSKYESGNASAVAGYISELGVKLRLNHQTRHAIRVGIYRSMARRNDKAGAAAESSESGQQNLAAARRIADSLVCSILRDTVSSVGLSFHDALGKLLDAERGLACQPDTILQWINGRARQSAETEAELARATHLVYVACCQVLGPVAGDKLLKKAADRAQALPEAAQCPPVRLLYPEQR